MRETFEPIGTRARWRILYEDVLQNAKVDQIVTYDELGERLDTADRHIVQQAMRRAARELEEQELRAVDNVPRVGYRIVKPEEHLLLARRHQRRSSRSLVRGNSKVKNVDLNEVPAELRPAFQALGQAFAIQMEVNRRLSVGQRQLKQAVEAIDEKLTRESERTEAEVAALKARLAALEESTKDGEG